MSRDRILSSIFAVKKIHGRKKISPFHTNSRMDIISILNILVHTNDQN